MILLTLRQQGTIQHKKCSLLRLIFFSTTSTTTMTTKSTHLPNSTKFPNSSPATKKAKPPASKEEWEKKLTQEKYSILVEKGTEPAYSGVYDKFFPKEDGYFVCAGCDTPLYKKESKFDSGSGWPSFEKCLKGKVTKHIDNSLGNIRTEIACSFCNGHLGHVFKDEGFTKTNERHCVNSLSLKFVKGKLPNQEENEEVTVL